MHARRGGPVVATRRMERRRRRRRALVALGVTSALLIGTAYGTWRYIDENEYLLTERCEVVVGEETMEITPTQAHNAAMISASAVDRGLPPEAAVHAVAISLQESELRVREADDERDSRVLFARGTPSWSDGPSAQAAENSIEGFFDVLEESWRAGLDAEEEESAPEYWSPELGLDEAAEVLQRPHNAQFYPQHAGMARAFAWPLAGQQPMGLNCHLSQLEVPAVDPEGAAAELALLLPDALEIPFTDPEEDADAEEGTEDEEAAEPEPQLEGIVEISGEGESAEMRISLPAEATDYDPGWLLAQWAVASARDYGIQTVSVGSYTWDRDRARWQPQEEPVADDEVVLGFSRDR